LPAIINYALVKFVFENSRVSGEINIIESINKIATGMVSLFINTFQIIPKCFFLGVLGIVIVIGVFINLKSTTERKRKILVGLGGVYVIIGTILVCIFPHIMEATQSIWIVARSNYAIASIIGILLLYIYMNFNINNILEKIVIAIIIVYLTFQYIGFQTIIRDNYIVGYQDQYTCKQIGEKVEQYEKTTGITVSKIAFYYNEISYSYPNVYANGDINIKAMYTEWSRLNSLNYYLNRDFEQTEQSEEIYNQYFKDKQWNYFDDEQIVLIDDTLHIYIY
jgi:hypothetical protein